MKKPQLLFLGAHPRVVGIIDAYSLIGNADFVVADRARSGGMLGPHEVADLASLKYRKFEHVIITEDLIRNYEDAQAFLKDLGYHKDQIITVSQPGRMHRLLRDFSPLRQSATAMKKLGYILVRKFNC